MSVPAECPKPPGANATELALLRKFHGFAMKDQPVFASTKTIAGWVKRSVRWTQEILRDWEAKGWLAVASIGRRRSRLRR